TGAIDQVLLQRVARAREARLHHIFAHAEHLSRLGGAEALDLSKHKDFPIAVAEGIDGRFDERAQLAAERLTLWIGPSGPRARGAGWGGGDRHGGSPPP